MRAPEASQRNAPRRLKTPPVFLTKRKGNNLEEINEHNNCHPWKDEEEPDDWAVAVLTAGFAIGVAAAIAAIKLFGKFVEK